MKKLNLILFLLSISTVAFSDNRQLLDELDKAIEQRPQFLERKKARINLLNDRIKNESDSISILNYINNLFEEYHVFQFDSALVYADRGLSMANRQNNAYFKTLFTIHMAEILAKGGMYHEAAVLLDGINPEGQGQDIHFIYYYAYFTTYSYWSDYCSDSMFAGKYRQKANEYLKLAMQYADQNDALNKFYQGEQQVYIDGDPIKAKNFYQNTLKSTKEDSRIYAMASFALAGNYKVGGNEEKYEEYLIRAALSDIKGCTMENMALQSLAILLFSKKNKDIERAERYINESMSDAKFYNNKLRILEISRFMPQIMNTYQEEVKSQNKSLHIQIALISILLLILLITAYYIFRQNGKLAARRKELATQYRQVTDLNSQLEDSNKEQSFLNKQLKELNERLISTNKRRESLASIYIDLCAKYIDKMTKYQTLVKRKIKANQAQELLQTTHPHE